MPDKKEKNENKKDLNIDFIKEWTTYVPIDLDEMVSNFHRYYDEAVEQNMANPYEEAKQRLYIELKSDMQSGASLFDGYIFGYTEPFDWTKAKREKCLEEYKLNPENAIAKGFVIMKDNKPVPLFWDCKNESMRTRELERSLIRTVYGICIKMSSLHDIELLNDVINKKVDKNKKYKSLKMAEYTSGKVDLQSELASKWSDAKWFDMTISNEQADPEEKKKGDKSKYVEVENSMLFKHINFRAINKSSEDTPRIYTLNCSSTTKFTNSIAPKEWFDVNFIKAQPRCLPITELDSAFKKVSDLTEKKKDNKNTQTTKTAYCVEGILSGEPMPNQYSVIFNLDDLSLGFNKDKKVTLFMPLGTEKILGKNSKLIVFGTLTRQFDTIKKGYQYPSINVSSYFPIRIVKPVVEDNKAIELLQVEKGSEEVKTVKVEDKKDKEKPKEEDEFNF